jgi:protease YdgD
VPIDTLLRRADVVQSVRKSCRLAARAAAVISATAALSLPSAGVAAAGPFAAGGLQNHTASSSHVRKVAVFGTDDRVPVPAKYQAVADRIGLLFNNRTRTVCTAFCLAPNVIGTAAHCLFKPQSETPSQLAHYWFARGYDRQRDFSRIAGYANGAAPQNILAGATHLSVRPPIDAASDWALVRLTHAICQKGVLAVRPMPSAAIIKAASERRIFQIAYHRDLAQWKPAYSQPCDVTRRFGPIDWTTIARDFTSPDQLILHTCDTGGASSGSPLLIDTAEGPAVVGVNIGTYEQSRVLVQAGQVTHRFKSETVANTGVNASVFASKVALLAQARIVASSLEIRAIQVRLQQRGYYQGPIDGAHGPQLRLAIQQFEEHERLPKTGLPTIELTRYLALSPEPIAIEPRDGATSPKPLMRRPVRASSASLHRP